MSKITNSSTTHDKAQLMRYLISGLSAVGTDLVTYWLFLPIAGPSIAKGLSFAMATCVAYTLNKYWTFKMKQRCWREASRFAILYGTSLILNIIVNKVVIMVAPTVLPAIGDHVFKLGWLAATGASTVYNFIGQKLWVFRASPDAPSTAEAAASSLT